MEYGLDKAKEKVDLIRKVLDAKGYIGLGYLVGVRIYDRIATSLTFNKVVKKLDVIPKGFEVGTATGVRLILVKFYDQSKSKDQLKNEIFGDLDILLNWALNIHDYKD